MAQTAGRVLQGKGTTHAKVMEQEGTQHDEPVGHSHFVGLVCRAGAFSLLPGWTALRRPTRCC